jgi:hypothetical protein
MPNPMEENYKYTLLARAMVKNKSIPMGIFEE